MIIKFYVLKKKKAKSDSHKNYLMVFLSGFNEEKLDKKLWAVLDRHNEKGYKCIFVWRQSLFEYMILLLPFIGFRRDVDGKLKIYFTKEAY